MVGIIFYFALASKIKLGFDTTIVLAVSIILMIGVGLGGLSPLLAFTTIIVGLMAAWVFNKIIGNR
jgi:hypothetical protein